MAEVAMLQAALAGLALAGVIALPAWAASVPLRDASLADRVWGGFIAAPALLYALLRGMDARTLVMLVLLCAWALRLTVYISWRNWGHGEDRRYQAIRARNQPGFALKSLWLVFGLQALLAWMVGWPVLAAAGRGAPWTLWDSAGALLALSGLAMEAVADAQLARFKRDPAQRGRVMDQGLWRYSRHPNYFGECCVWWGLALMGLAGAGLGHAWLLASPVLMTVLLLRVSGVALLERDLSARRPAYRDYVARTSAFIPWPPRRQPS